ncbi:isoleucine--tRNA ligase [hot springs metagenome]|uniref:isoleucine--tRNA ligase n=1 Tax=hot springs metagenome TaxID=433727 RepID=A0A5J4L1J2_9ZZZZ
MPIDYKDTLNLPQTDFPMKANLNQKEPEILEFWENKRIYQKIQEKNKGNKSFILHDGPPYANGNIHIGHALNKILKDIIVKYKSMQGYYSPYVPGWDCHGLPIELQVDKEISKLKAQSSKVEGSELILQKRQFCREYADKFVNIQRQEFKRLGVFGDWQKPYLTMSYDYEASIVREFFKFVKNGSVYKGKKPVHWCPSCVTALAEAEVEYAEKESPSIFVRFQIVEDDILKYLPQLMGKKVYIVIWTTTPWTLPANLALAVHPELVYAAIEDGEVIHIVAEDNLTNLKGKGIIKGDVILKISGDKLQGIRTKHPFIERQSNVVLGDFVTVGEGSGIVHIAPGHGEDDYEVGLKYGLDIYAPVDDKGKFTKHVPEFEGQFVFKANEGIIELLKEKGALLNVDKIKHSYPHCWRCKKPVIFRATAQWFISMQKRNLRQKCLKEIERIEWIPSWGKERIYTMLLNRPDWCVSRQRSWGVPITLITCEDCGAFIEDEELFDKIVKLIGQQGADVWFKTDIGDLLRDGYRCKCGSTSFKKEMDILDVWFDSGVSHAAVLERDERLSWPAEMYLEGSDQHRGWFQSSLLASVGTRDRAPYNIVLTHGFTVDGQGKKMSKSLGNVIAPDEVIKANGADILRLWVSAEDYRDDVRLSKEIINRLTEAYRKIRNTERFLLGNIYDYDRKDYSKDLLEIDRWAMSRLQNLIRKVTEAYENFNFHEVFHLLYNFCIVDMSSFYLDILKDRLYTFRADSKERRAAQWVMYQILIDMTRLTAPILSFTAEEIWQTLQKTEDRRQGIEFLEESVFLSDFPTVREEFVDKELERRWERLIKIRDEANKALEIKRKDKFIGNSLEARLVFYLPADELKLLENYRDFLATLFIVSEAEIYPSEQKRGDVYESAEIKNMFISVEKASGAKCERCWNWSESVGKFEDYPQICKRCYSAIR